MSLISQKIEIDWSTTVCLKDGTDDFPVHVIAELETAEDDGFRGNCEIHVYLDGVENTDAVKAADIENLVDEAWERAGDRE